MGVKSNLSNASNHLGVWVLGFGFWDLGFGFWVLGLWVLGFWILGFWVFGFGVWVMGFGFCHDDAARAEVSEGVYDLDPQRFREGERHRSAWVEVGSARSAPCDQIRSDQF